MWALWLKCFVILTFETELAVRNNFTFETEFAVHFNN